MSSIQAFYDARRRCRSHGEQERLADALRATACRARPQLLSVAGADSAASTVAAQLPRSFSASSEREPGSAAYVESVSPWSAATSRRLKLRLSSPTTGWLKCLTAVEW